MWVRMSGKLNWFIYKAFSIKQREIILLNQPLSERIKSLRVSICQDKPLGRNPGQNLQIDNYLMLWDSRGYVASTLQKTSSEIGLPFFFSLLQSVPSYFLKTLSSKRKKICNLERYPTPFIFLSTRIASKHSSLQGMLPLKIPSVNQKRRCQVDTILAMWDLFQCVFLFILYWMSVVIGALTLTIPLCGLNYPLLQQFQNCCKVKI